jgi:hypothetical protein
VSDRGGFVYVIDREARSDRSRGRYAKVSTGIAGVSCIALEEKLLDFHGFNGFVFAILHRRQDSRNDCGAHSGAAVITIADFSTVCLFNPM